MFSWFKLKKKEKVKFVPKEPLTWWIDDLSHRVCGLVDDPKFGINRVSWPDCEHVYFAVNKKDYDEVCDDLEKACNALVATGYSLSDRLWARETLERLNKRKV